MTNERPSCNTRVLSEQEIFDRNFLSEESRTVPRRAEAVDKIGRKELDQVAPDLASLAVFAGPTRIAGALAPPAIRGSSRGGEEKAVGPLW